MFINAWNCLQHCTCASCLLYPPEKPLACITAKVRWVNHEWMQHVCCLSCYQVNQRMKGFCSSYNDQIFFQAPLCSCLSCSAKREDRGPGFQQWTKMVRCLLLRLRSGTDIILLMYSVGRTRLMGSLKQTCILRGRGSLNIGENIGSYHCIVMHTWEAYYLGGQLLREKKYS